MIGAPVLAEVEALFVPHAASSNAAPKMIGALSLRTTIYCTEFGASRAPFLGGRGCGCFCWGAVWREWTSTERSNSITMVPSCLYPVLRTRTTPCPGRDFDGRVSRISDWA